MASPLKDNEHFTPLPHQQWKLNKGSVVASTPLLHCSDESGYSTICTSVESDSSSKFLTPSFPRVKGELLSSIISDDGSLEIGHTSTSDRSDDTFWVQSHFRMVVPISGQEVGEEYVDFLKELSRERSCENVVSLVLSYLTPKELCTITWVSSAWRKACLADKNAKRKVVKYLNDCKERTNGVEKENCITGKMSPEKHHGRVPFNNVQNVVSMRNDVLTQNAKKMSPPKTRQQIFAEEAKKLQAGERLRLCPRCSSPSRVDLVFSRGQCSRKSCAYDFCVRCFKEFHQLLPCESQREPLRTSKNYLIGSKKSKHHLKRL